MWAMFARVKMEIIERVRTLFATLPYLDFELVLRPPIESTPVTGHLGTSL
jgi:hypothetical protein